MSSDWVAYVDGEWGPAEAASVNVLDHGLLYGDGVFEGIRFYGREPFLLDAHLRRLEASARALALDLPLDRAALGDLCREGARRSATDDGYLRLVVTRGRGALGVSPHTCGAALADPDRGAARALLRGGAAARRARRHLGPAPLRARRAAAAGQEPQLPDQRAGLDRGPPPGRRGGDPAQRAGPDLGVHGGQPVRRPRRRACARRPIAHGALDGITRALVHGAAGRPGHPGRGGAARARRRLDGRRDLPHRHRRRDRAGPRGRRPARRRARPARSPSASSRPSPTTSRRRSWVEPSTRTQVPAGR